MRFTYGLTLLLSFCLLDNCLLSAEFLNLTDSKVEEYRETHQGNLVIVFYDPSVILLDTLQP